MSESWTKAHVFQICDFESFGIIHKDSGNDIQAAKYCKEHISRKHILTDWTDGREDLNGVVPINATRNALIQSHHGPGQGAEELR
jgi:hypothetical protein